jgi:tetratricopeptide (TPR) repeat protein
MNKPKQAPEIFARPLASFAAPGLPAVGETGFAEAVIGKLSLEYASKGWNAAVVAQEGMLRVVAVPAEGGIDPKSYLLGLLKSGFLEDALPGLEALSSMVDDADIAFNYGVALSELGRVEESLAPLNRCLNIDPGYDNAAIAIGVSLAKLGRNEEAEVVLKAAAKVKPNDPLIKQNLAGVLARSGKMTEALPVFRQAASLAPDNPACVMGLAQCLDSLEGYEAEARKTYEIVAKKFPGTPFGEAAKQILNRQSTSNLHKAVDGAHRPDVVEYMLAAMKLFGELPREQVGQIVLEIARLGESGLAIHDPSKRYTLQNLEGDFSGLRLLSYMHVGLKMFDPRADSGSSLDREYEIAKGLSGK